MGPARRAPAGPGEEGRGAGAPRADLRGQRTETTHRAGARRGAGPRHRDPDSGSFGAEARRGTGDERHGLTQRGEGDPVPEKRGPSRPPSLNVHPYTNPHTHHRIGDGSPLSGRGKEWKKGSPVCMGRVELRISSAKVRTPKPIRFGRRRLGVRRGPGPRRDPPPARQRTSRRPTNEGSRVRRSN